MPSDYGKHEQGLGAAYWGREVGSHHTQHRKERVCAFVMFAHQRNTGYRDHDIITP